MKPEYIHNNKEDLFLGKFTPSDGYIVKCFLPSYKTDLEQHNLSSSIYKKRNWDLYFNSEKSDIIVRYGSDSNDFINNGVEIAIKHNQEGIITPFTTAYSWAIERGLISPHPLRKEYLKTFLCDLEEIKLYVEEIIKHDVSYFSANFISELNEKIKQLKDINYESTTPL